MSIQNKLLILILGLLTLSAINAGAGLYGMHNGNTDLRTMYDQRLVPLRDLKQIVDAYAVNIVDTNHKVRNGNLSLSDGIASLDYAAELIRRQWQDYQARPLTSDEQALVAAIQPLMVRADDATRQLRQLFAQGDEEAIARFAIDNLYPAIDPVSEAFSRLIEVQLAEASRQHQQAESHYQQALWLQLSLLLGGALAAFALSWRLIRHNVVKPLRAAGQVMAAIAEGDLSQPQPTAGNDEVGEIMRQLGVMQQGLRHLIAALRQNVVAVNGAAGELTASAKATAHVSQVQSLAASGVAASVEQLSVSIDQVHHHSHDARAITLASGQQLNQSTAVIHRATDGIRSIADAVNTAAATIHELEQLSDQISSIVGVISAIAAQTNLLALNAAIEAARAGAAGRGFAVVADEVRNLAERTSHSTQEIASMIERIQNGSRRAVAEMQAGVERVNQGVALSIQAGDSVEAIRSSGDQVNAVVDAIGDAIREQSAAARDITARVEEIAQGAEQNSSAVAQTAAAAVQLQQLATHLDELAGRFRV